MLNSHRNIVLPPESRFFWEYDPKLNGGDPLPNDEALNRYLDHCFSGLQWSDLDLPEQEFRRRIRESDRTARTVYRTIADIWCQRTGKTHFGEKTPLHERYIPRILEVFEHAQFIHVLRDPRDVVASMYRLGWGGGSNTCLRHARNWVKVLRRHEIFTRRLPSSQYTAVRFEDLVCNPESELKRVCDFLREPFDLNMLEYYNRRITDYSHREDAWKARTREPIQPNAIAGYRRVLSSRQIRTVERTIGFRMLRRYCYAPDPDVGDCMRWRMADYWEMAHWRIDRFRQSVAKRAARFLGAS